MSITTRTLVVDNDPDFELLINQQFCRRQGARGDQGQSGADASQSV